MHLLVTEVIAAVANCTRLLHSCQVSVALLYCCCLHVVWCNNACNIIVATGRWQRVSGMCANLPLNCVKLSSANNTTTHTLRQNRCRKELLSSCKFTTIKIDDNNRRFGHYHSVNVLWFCDSKVVSLYILHLITLKCVCVRVCIRSAAAVIVAFFK